MSHAPTLDQLTDCPQLDVEIGGRRHGFRELSIDALGRLQSVIKATVPHPLEALSGHLDALPESVRESILDRAYRDALAWPPVVGTAMGAAALLGSEAGQVAALHEGLLATEPATTREDAAMMYKQLRSEAAAEARAAKVAGRRHDGEGKVSRIFGVLFGMDPHAHEGDGPKE